MCGAGGQLLDGERAPADIPATGRRVTVQYVDFMRVRDGQIIEHWPSVDQVSFLQQLGVMPT